ncbi:hypothetical protein FB45DRAFT_922612 [Roridomyces roridus]|uniref:Uncharacterized protein n=1 Tax=Roridomyces roridus TaxID=1738132 RepID=A0AAD7BN77_9AGAR|nr:hypothetical protein FB45DRAFT_922612 [Roridomyces roridus]
MGSPFATQEDHESLWYEQSNYVSTHLASVGYGIHIVVFAIVTYYTLLARTRARSTYMWIVSLVFNMALFCMGTINLACSIKYNENAWVNERDYPGGPFNYLVEQQAIPFMTLGNVASILASFLSDGLLLYRVGVLWDFAWYIIVPPALFFVACIILSVMTVIQLALPNVPLPQLSLAVWIVLMILPIWLTALIAGRILSHRRTMIQVLGPSYAETYTGVSAIVVESAVPFTVISIVLLGLFGDKNTAQNLLIPLMVQVECIAPELIILRVMLGRCPVKSSRRLRIFTLPHTSAMPSAIRWTTPSSLPGLALAPPWGIFAERRMSIGRLWWVSRMIWWKSREGVAIDFCALSPEFRVKA